MIRRTIVPALLAATVLAIFATSAQASLGIASFSVTPSTAQAGGTLTQSGPDLSINARFSTTDADSPKDATIALAPGLLANPSIVPLCPASDFNSGWCPDSSQIGSGTITGTAPQFAFTLSLPTQAYLIQPQGSEAARIGLIVTFFDFPVATQSAPVSIRTRPNVGIDIPLTGLPNQLDGVPVTIDALHLTVAGSVGGQPFTRNPTYCTAATSTLTVDSYAAPTTSVSKSSEFTPTGCSGLPYSPTIAGTVTQDANDDGIAIQATITQQYDESDNRSIELTLPFSASPRLSALTAGCTNSNLSTCSPVGTATVTTPLLTKSLIANVVLVAHPNALPTLAILIPQPIGLTLTAKPILSGTAVQALVSNVPDVPISSLTLNLPGGRNSLFRAGVHLCTSPQSFAGTFTGWSGATASPTTVATVDGCPTSMATAQATSQAAAPAPQTNSQTAGPAPQPTSQTATPGSPQAASPRSARGGGSQSAAARAPRLTFTVRGPRVRSAVLRLPAALEIDRAGLARGVHAKLDGRRVRVHIRVVHGRLVVIFPRAGKRAVITVKAPAIRARVL